MHVWSDKEVGNLMKMQHRNVVTMIGAGTIVQNDIHVLFVVQEFMSGGSIEKVLWTELAHTVGTWNVRIGNLYSLYPSPKPES